MKMPSVKTLSEMCFSRGCCDPSHIQTLHCVLMRLTVQYTLVESFIYQIMNVVKFCFGFSGSESNSSMTGVYMV